MTLARQQPAKQVAPGKDSPNPTLLRKPPSFYKPRRKRGQSANGITPAIASGDGAGSHANGNGAGLVQPKDQVSTGSQ